MMPFPNASEAVTSPLSAKIPNHEAIIDFKSRIGYAAQQNFKEMKSSPKKSASLIYVGLCYLRHLHQDNKIAEGRALCTKTFNALLPDTGGGTGINCSYFTAVKPGFVDHQDGIANAMNLFMPTEGSKKKRCAVLLAIGANKADEFLIPGATPDAKRVLPFPKDDSWIPTFDWRP